LLINPLLYLSPEERFGAEKKFFLSYGVIPKIAVAYAGTYAVGQAIYQWCANGEKLQPERLKAMYVAAFKRGREVAQSILAKRKALRAPGS